MSIQLELLILSQDPRLTKFEQMVCSDASLIVADVTKLTVTAHTMEQNIHHEKEELKNA
jgi:hypothetical protein